MDTINILTTSPYLTVAADLDKSKCYHIRNKLKYCLIPASVEDAPQPGVTTIVTSWGCNKDWELFCPTSEGYIKHFTSGLCIQSDNLRKDLIVLTDDCWAEFEEVPDRGGIVDKYSGGCILPYDPFSKHPEEPHSFTPVGIIFSSDCEVKDAQLFFNRG